VVSASTNNHGHVSLAVQIVPTPWLPVWSAQVTLSYNLGDLIRLGDQVEEWFWHQRPDVTG
jgi:hypothetical protein